MADAKEPRNPRKPLQEDSVVARLRDESGGEAPTGLTPYTGLLGRSSREGYWLLYPTLDMGTSIEIQESDIVHSESLAPEQSPFGGLGGTRVYVRKGATVTTTRTVSRAHPAGEGDEFDLDIRVGGREPGPADTVCQTGIEYTCGETGGSCFGTCGNTVCGTCVYTCNCTEAATCGRSCSPNTCNETYCAATCGMNTCNTCATQCNQDTCVTCQTCNTCPTNCGTCNQTCAPTCYTCQTCFTACGTCTPTCFNTCAETCHCPRPTLQVSCRISDCGDC